MTDPIFNFIDLTENDHVIGSVDYSGKVIKDLTCFIAISDASCSIFSALTEGLSPIGFFLINLSTVLNTVDYANGKPPVTQYLRTYRNPVFQLGNFLLFIMEKTNYTEHQLVTSLINTFLPKNIEIFDSFQVSHFKQLTPIIKPFQTYVLSESQESSSLPYPATVSGLTAGFLIYSSVNNIETKAFIVAESADGPSIESLTLFANEISLSLKFDVTTISQYGLHLHKIRHSNQNSIFT